MLQKTYFLAWYSDSKQFQLDVCDILDTPLVDNLSSLLKQDLAKYQPSQRAQVLLKKISDCPEPFAGKGDECMKKSRKRQVGGILHLSWIFWIFLIVPDSTYKGCSDTRLQIPIKRSLDFSWLRRQLF
jgi:hypothetical protein